MRFRETQAGANSKITETNVKRNRSETALNELEIESQTSLVHVTASYPIRSNCISKRKNRPSGDSDRTKRVAVNLNLAVKKHENHMLSLKM